MATKSDIRLLMLDTGEHIIGFVTQNDGHELTVETPVSLVPNNGGVGMMPYLQFAKENTCTFRLPSVRHVLTPDDQLLEGYNNQFGSRIITPATGNGPGGIALV